MQFKNPNSKNWQKLKEIARNNRCHICHHRLRNTGVFVWSVPKDDCTHIRCSNCGAMYNTSFLITDLGIPREVGYA